MAYDRQRRCGNGGDSMEAAAAAQQQGGGDRQSFCRCLLQQLAFSESHHFNRDKDPANTMARQLMTTRERNEF